MIIVSIDETSEGYKFKCNGHANYGPTGQDIVCAGVSALCIALISEINELEDTNSGIFIENEIIGNGNVCITFSTDENIFTKTTVATVMETIIKGIKEIEKLYPEYVVCDFENDDFEKI